MYSLKSAAEFIYNENKEVVVKFTNATVYSGPSFQMPDMYSYFEVWVLQSSYCTIQMKSAEFRLYQGDVLVFSKNENKEIISSNANAVFLKLQIDATAFIKLSPSIPAFDNSNFFVVHSDKFNNRIPASYTAAKNINTAFSQIAKLFEIKRNYYQLDVIKECYSIILTVLRDTNYIGDNLKVLPEKNIAKSNVALKRAIDYIDSHITEDLTLKKISTIADLSPNYLSNIFRENTGVRLWDYICEKRISLATQLLVDNPNDSVISVALKCGFNNCPNFNRAFKKYTGQTPMKYKTSILRQEG